MRQFLPRTMAKMCFRLRKLLVGSLLIVVWALAAAVTITIWGEETWQYFAHVAW